MLFNFRRGNMPSGVLKNFKTCVDFQILLLLLMALMWVFNAHRIDKSYIMIKIKGIRLMFKLPAIQAETLLICSQGILAACMIPGYFEDPVFIEDIYMVVF